MNRSRKRREQLYLRLEKQLKDIIAPELKELVEIFSTLPQSFGFLESRLKSGFPKDCKKCGAVYHSFEQFFYGTDEIAKGTVNYPAIGSEFYLHRNCKAPCQSTLVVIFNDRRDDTPVGTRRRQLFGESLDKVLAHAPVQKPLARKFLLDLLLRHMQQRAKVSKLRTSQTKTQPSAPSEPS